jgi:cytochrome P450
MKDGRGIETLALNSSSVLLAMEFQSVMHYDTVSFAPLVLSSISAGLLLLALGSRLRKHASHPPGPRGLPFVGNLLSLSLKGTWRTLTELKQRYGDLVFFHGFGQSVLVLNSMEAIDDLLNKRGQNYSHRPVFTVVGELMGLNQGMPLLPCDKEWRNQRKIVNSAFSQHAIKQYHVLQEQMAATLCLEISKDPSDFFSLVRLCAIP